MIDTILEDWLFEAQKAKASGDLAGVARAKAVARWMVHVANCSSEDYLLGIIADTAKVMHFTFLVCSRDLARAAVRFFCSCQR